MHNKKTWQKNLCSIWCSHENVTTSDVTATGTTTAITCNKASYLILNFIIVVVIPINHRFQQNFLGTGEPIVMFKVIDDHLMPIFNFDIEEFQPRQLL